MISLPRKGKRAPMRLHGIDFFRNPVQSGRFHGLEILPTTQGASPATSTPQKNTMNKYFTAAVALAAGLTLGVAQADDGKGGKGKGGAAGKGDPGKRAEMMLKRLDKDESGTISKEEFASGAMAKKLAEKRGDDAVGKIFGMRDKNGDGELDKEELSAPPKRGKGGKAGKGGKKKDGDS